MMLTPIGQALVPHATLMARVAEHAREEMNALRGLAKGTIRVGCIASVAGLILPEAIHRVLTQWPNLRIEVIEGVWNRLADALIGHEIDLALGVSMQGSEEITPIADCSWEDDSYVVASMRHPLRRQTKVTLSDTLNQRWASTPRGTEPFAHMQDAFKSQGLGSPSIVVETRSVITLKSLVTHAGFLCWMAGPMFEDERQAGLIDALPIAELRARRRLTVFRRRHGILPEPAIKLLEAIRKITGGS